MHVVVVAVACRVKQLSLRVAQVFLGPSRMCPQDTFSHLMGHCLGCCCLQCDWVAARPTCRNADSQKSGLRAYQQQAKREGGTSDPMWTMTGSRMPTPS